MNQSQLDQNVTLEQALRRASLLAAAAEVSHNITQIMDIDDLLPKTVDIICDAYGFYYAGIFLVNETGDFAVLKAGRGEPGRIMIKNSHKLAVGGNSMIGACVAHNEARISLDVDTEQVWYPNPVLPETRSEMALPLAIGDRVFGAVTVQSVEAAAFSNEDVSSLQAMANQLAIAIDNAWQRRELEKTHAELLRVKTFEAIANATGDAIHWIGNKAEPITGSVDRIRDDLALLVCAVAEMLREPGVAEQVEQFPLAQLILEEAGVMAGQRPEPAAAAVDLYRLPLKKLAQRLDLASTLDDLHIIEDAARRIIEVKEELIGPAREHAPRPTMLDDVVKDTITLMQLPAALVAMEVPASLPLVRADPVQLNRVFTNLLKNAQEATSDRTNPQITISFAPDKTQSMVHVAVTDNGPGIPKLEQDKIWVTFHTTKGASGHSGLGLPACRLILEQMGGRISMESTPGQGATFIVSLPIARNPESGDGFKSKGKILLIDDVDSWRHFALHVLEKAGCKVSAPRAALETIEPEEYDLILMDDILAGQSSAAVLHLLKKKGAVHKVLLVSSNPRVEQTKDRLLMGVKNLLPKPYTAAGLLPEVMKAMRL